MAKTKRAGNRGRTTPASRATRAPSVRKPVSESPRYTRPIPKSMKESPRIWGAAILVLLVGGAATIVLNYTGVFGQSSWALLVGIALMVGGLVMAVNYR